MRVGVAVSTLLLFAGLAVAEDTVTLKDGRVLTGDVLAITLTDIQIQTAEEKIRVPKSAIEKLERDGVAVDLSAPPPTRPRRPPRSAPPARVYEATPALIAWLDVCAAQLAADDEGVRAGATAALLSAGNVAIPVLENAIENDSHVALTAKRLVAQLERKKQRAAGPPPPVGEAATRTERIAALERALQLSAEQEPGFRSIIGEYQRKQAELKRSLHSGAVEISEVGGRTTALRNEADEKLAKLLTEEQMQEYIKLTPRPENRQPKTR